MAKFNAPRNCVAVRMYRIGHGDCFLLAMPRDGGGRPVYVLIDCGFKPGSSELIRDSPRSIEEIVTHLGESTDYHLDLVIITHEHQDHVNGIWKKTDPYFEKFTIDEAWMAWTEDGDDALANQLRLRHRDQLLGLIEARNKLSLALGGDHALVGRLETFLQLEIGGHGEVMTDAAMRGAASDPTKSINKQSMKLIKDKAKQQRGVAYLSPGGLPRSVPGTPGIRAFVLGPPRSEKLLQDENPVGNESFPDDSTHGLTFAAAAASATGAGAAPFSARYCISADEALALGADELFFRSHYGAGNAGHSEVDQDEVHDNAPWRRIDSDWLLSAEQLALQLNTGINNTSLVLAFELPTTKKVLLFAGDAQRGNWISWADVNWDQTDEKISTRDLLARTVLYKVGHHGSHNATMNGSVSDKHANLGWMGLGSAAGEFTAMITAVNEWALNNNNPPWRHPLPSIKRALLQKASGRVFQTDEPAPTKPDSVSDAAWDEFLANVKTKPLYFEYLVSDG